MRQIVRALRHRNFRLFYFGQAASMVGMWLQLTALSWLMYRLTGAAAAVALMTFAWQGPGLLIGPIAGAFADRHDRRKILIAAQAGSVVPALVLGVLTLLGVVVPWHVVSLALVTGVVRSFEIPTRQAFIPELVEREDLANAIGLNSALFNGARLIGPALAGAMIPLVGEAWCFLLNGVSYTGIVIALFAIRLPAHRGRPDGGRSLIAEIREGLDYVREQPALMALLAGLSVAAVAGMPYSVLLPSFANRQLGGGPDTFGLLQAAVGLGALVGAFGLATRSKVRGLERWVTRAGLSFGVLLVAFSATRSLATALLLLVPLGLSFMIMLATTNTLLQTLVPGRLRGRVMSLHTTLFLGLFPLSGLAWGALADRYGEAAVLAGGGVAVTFGSLFTGRAILRHAPRAIETAQLALDASPQPSAR
ncbi:MAG: MFS transporter [Acidobacteriota bacterium]|nr:MFS transporter [Acidobacteriota bacterium]